MLKALWLLPVLAGLCIISGFPMPGPCSCDILLYKNWDITTSQKTIDRALRREASGAPKNYFKEADILFSKAYLGYLKTAHIDTSLFFAAEEHFKTSYTKSKNATRKAEALNKIALCYYYTGDYQASKRFFRKAIQGKYAWNGCAALNYSKCFYKTNRPDSFEMVIRDYCLANTLNADSVKEVVLTDLHNGH